MSSQSHALLWRNGAFQFGDQKLDNIQSSSKPENEEATQLDSAVKPKRQSKPKFTADYLIGDNGLSLIYNEFPNIKFSDKPGKELSNLKLLITKYQEWMYQLYPLNFVELTKKIETMSGNRMVQNECENLRNKRDGIADNNIFGNDDDFDIFGNNNENQNNNNNENNNHGNQNSNENMNNNNNNDFDFDFDFDTDMNANNNSNNNGNNNNNLNSNNSRILPGFMNQNRNVNENPNTNNTNRNIGNVSNNAHNNNNNNNNNEEIQDIDIETEMMMNMGVPGDDEDELADMLFDEY